MIEYVWTIKDDTGKQYFVYIDGTRTDITNVLSDSEKHIIDVTDNMEVVKVQVKNALTRQNSLQLNLL